MAQNVLRLLTIERAQWAVARIRRQARIAGVDQLTLADIDSEIRLARAERPRNAVVDQGGEASTSARASAPVRTLL